MRFLKALGISAIMAFPFLASATPMAVLDRVALGRPQLLVTTPNNSGLPLDFQSRMTVVISDAPGPALSFGDALTSPPVYDMFLPIEIDRGGQTSRVGLLGEGDSESISTRVSLLILILMLGVAAKYLVSPSFYTLLSNVCSTLTAIEHDGRDLPE
jgi:hypothetical protein